MATVAHRTPRLAARSHRGVSMWLLGAILVAAVATALALALIGSGDPQTDRGGEAAQPSHQAPVPLAGPRP
jgi:hypothetical protein